MLKLSLALLILLGTSAAQDVHPITELQGNSRVLIVFAPNVNSDSYKRQLLLIERHAFELTESNTVVVPISLADVAAPEHTTGENLPMASSDQADARTRFHVQPGDFLVILLNQDGTEQIRSANPVDIHQLTANLDAGPKH